MTYRSSTGELAIRPVDHLDISLERADEVPGCLILRLKGYLDTYNGYQFQRQMEKVAAAGYTRLVFDMAGVTYISSGPVAGFVDLLKEVRSQDGDVVLVSMQPRVMEVFDLLGLIGFFRVADSVEEGLGLFARSTEPLVMPFRRMDRVTDSFSRLETFVAKKHHPALSAELIGLLEQIGDLTNGQGKRDPSNRLRHWHSSTHA